MNNIRLREATKPCTIFDKKKWDRPTDMMGQLDEPICLLRTENKEGTERYAYRDKNGEIIEPKAYNKVKIARAFQEQKIKDQQRWDAENTCPYCGMVLSTREAQDRECDNCGGKL